MSKIGVDIVEISRMEKSIKNERFLKKVFTEQEIEYCKSVQSFAGIFAAKEAYFKAIGTGITYPITDVEVFHNENGKPYLNVNSTDLSISHDGNYAVAVVLIND